MEEDVGDAPLQLVLVGLVDQPSEPLHAPSGLGHAGPDVILDVAALLLERVDEGAVQLRSQAQGAHGVQVHRADLLLPDVLVPVAGARAAVVGVLLLLPLGGDGGSTASAGDHSREREGPALRARVGEAVQAGLHALEQLPADDLRVASFVPDPGPPELSCVERVPQDVVDLALGDLSAPLAPVALLGAPPRQLLHRPVAGVVHLEDAPHQQGAVWVEDDQAAPPFAAVEVADRRGAGPVAVRRLVVHALADLFGEVVYVVLRHQDLDAVNELLRGPRLLRQDDPLIDEVDVHVHPVERDPVLEIAVEAVGLLDEDRRRLRPLLLQELHHARERGAPGSLRGFDVHELFEYVHALLRGVGAEELELGWDGEALALLLAGGDPRVEDRLADRGSIGGAAVRGAAAQGSTGHLGSAPLH